MVGFTQVDLGAGVIAGFTNRFGGVSQAPYESLNLGANVSDNVAAVAANRRRVADLVGGSVAFSTQVHGADFIEIDDAAVAAWDQNSPPLSVGEADALITSTPVGLGVLVADCVPILLAADGVVATAHAGRRGIEKNVISVIVAQMRRRGATNIQAAIGPAICGRCYEVPAEMRAEVIALEPAAWAETRAGTPGLDLPAAAQDQLERLGVTVSYRSPYCTLEHPDYFSHRRAAGGQTGRQAGIVRLVTTV